MAYVIYDENELPLGVFDRAKEASELVGIRLDSFYKQMMRRGEEGRFQNGMRYAKVDIDDKD